MSIDGFYIFYLTILEGKFLSSWRQDRGFSLQCEQTPILTRSNFIYCLFCIARGGGGVRDGGLLLKETFGKRCKNI